MTAAGGVETFVDPPPLLLPLDPRVARNPPTAAITAMAAIAPMIAIGRRPPPPPPPPLDFDDGHSNVSPGATVRGAVVASTGAGGGVSGGGAGGLSTGGGGGGTGVGATSAAGTGGASPGEAPATVS